MFKRIIKCDASEIGKMASNIYNLSILASEGLVTNGGRCSESDSSMGYYKPGNVPCIRI